MDNIAETPSNASSPVRLYRIPKRVLKRARSQPFTQDFTVIEVGHLPYDRHSLTAPPRRHASKQLVFLTAGQVTLTLDGAPILLKERQALLLPAGSVYQYAPEQGSPWSAYWLKFEGSGTDKLLAWTPFPKQIPVVDCTALENIKRHFNAILNAMESGYTEHTTLQLSLALIKILISLHENPLDQKNKGFRHQIEATMSQMREDLAAPKPLRHYAEKAGYSVTQFSYLFRQHTGTSPMNYLNELRIQKASEYLKNSDWSIKEIADKLGFEDPLYFSRNFRKCVGLAPSAYRRR